jgi:hypothetical protein
VYTHLTPVVTIRCRVLVIANEKATEPHQKVVAICLEQNLVGRGHSPQAALHDLYKVLVDSFQFEMAERLPVYRADPDPELIRIFESDATHTADGDLVLWRLEMTLTAGVGAPKGNQKLRPSITYEECGV